MKNILAFSEASNVAIHALAYLATLGPGIPASATQIAKDISVSESHLSKVMQRLVREGMINSSRGAKGGFFFESDPMKITLLEVFETLEGSVQGGACLLGKPICTEKHCSLQRVSSKVADLVKEELAGTTLGDIAISPALDFKKAQASS